MDIKELKGFFNFVREWCLIAFITRVGSSSEDNCDKGEMGVMYQLRGTNI